MFKKLRNKLLIVNTLIIAALLLGSFSVIYITTARNTSRNVDQKLERAINFAHNAHEPRMGEGMHRMDGEAPAGGEQPPAKPEGEMREMRDIPPEGQDQMFSLTFTVTSDADGNVQNVNMPFTLDEDFYSDNISDFISDGEGRLKSDSGYWAYKSVKSENGYVTAFTQINSEQAIMRNLLIVLSLVALMALVLAFLIGLFSANRSIKPVEESYNKQKQFVADASHELKTPLTTINTNVDVLLSHEDSTIREEKKWLDYIKTETERMTKLTNDLLYLARLDHKENAVMLSRVSFSEAAENVILLMEAVVFEKNVNMKYDIASDLFVNASMEQLKQLVLILLDNAVKYTSEKGDIEIKLYRDASDAVFKIRNSGEGISEEAQKHIFERFYREDKSRARESGGYGLGLAIAHAIVTSYKGSIKVSSEKNKYTQFKVKIPLTK